MRMVAEASRTSLEGGAPRRRGSIDGRFVVPYTGHPRQAEGHATTRRYGTFLIVTHPFSLEAGETLAAEASATYYVTRLVAQAGRLYATDRRLLFAPEGRLERALGGGYPVEMALDDIQRFECEGSSTRRVLIRTAVQSYRFVGRGLEEIERHVGSAVARHGGVPTEQVLATARVHLCVSRLLTQAGRLYLTNRRVSFVPLGVLDRAVGARATTLPIEEILGLISEGSVDRYTALRGRGRNLVFLGHLPPAFVEGVRDVLATRGRSFTEQRSSRVVPPRAEDPGAEDP